MAGDNLTPPQIMEVPMDDSERDLIASFQDHVNKTPKLVVDSVNTLAQSPELVTRIIGILRKDPESLVVFGNVCDIYVERVDRHLEFDEETETRIANSPRFKSLLAERDKPDADKETVRDKIRFFRISEFAGRMVMFQRTSKVVAEDTAHVA
jgi:hypothetical protein